MLRVGTERRRSCAIILRRVAIVGGGHFRPDGGRGASEAACPRGTVGTSSRGEVGSGGIDGYIHAPAAPSPTVSFPCSAWERRDGAPAPESVRHAAIVRGGHSLTGSGRRASGAGVPTEDLSPPTRPGRRDDGARMRRGRRRAAGEPQPERDADPIDAWAGRAGPGRNRPVGGSSLSRPLNPNTDDLLDTPLEIRPPRLKTIDTRLEIVDTRLKTVPPRLQILHEGGGTTSWSGGTTCLGGGAILSSGPLLFRSGARLLRPPTGSAKSLCTKGSHLAPLREPRSARFPT